MSTTKPPLPRDSSGSSSKRQKLQAEVRTTQGDIDRKRRELERAEEKVSKTEEAVRTWENYIVSCSNELHAALREGRVEAEAKWGRERDEFKVLWYQAKVERDQAKVEREQLIKEFEALKNQLSITQRLVHKLPPDASEYFQAIAKLGAPSDLCPHRAWWKAQNLGRSIDPLFLCFVPPEAQPQMPLELAEEVFSEFIVNAKEGTVEKHDCEFIEDLCNLVCQELKDEQDMADRFRSILTDYLGLQVELNSIKCKLTKSPFPTDGCVMVAGWMALLIEVKLDPKTTLFQCMQYYAVHVAKLKETVREDSFFPCFLVELVGTCIRISGLVYSEKVTCQPLTPFLHCYINRFDRSNMNTLCRAMRALKTGLLKLKNMGSAALLRNKNIPYCICSPEWEFQERISEKLVFVMKKKDTEQLKVVKFCRQYGVSVHKAWATEGLAPPLIKHDKRQDGWHVIEMEFLHPDEWKSVHEWISSTSHTSTLIGQLKTSIKNALSQAHALCVDDKQVAHGDMRSPNIMVRERDEGGRAFFDVKFVDFDWSGEVNVTLYPTFMNMDLNWDEDVGPGKPLHQKHDEHCVNALFAEH